MRTTKEWSARFVDWLKGARGKCFVLLTQVDPDALASATAIAEVVERLNPKVQTQIAYCGAIGHPQNQAIFNRFGLGQKMVPITKIAPESLRGGALILVDSSDLDDRRIPDGFRPINPVVVIDHHNGELANSEQLLVWNEPVGSASTLVYELARELGVKLQDRTALLIALGIYTDTHSLMQSCDRDRQAYNALASMFRREDFVSLAEYEFPPSYFDHLDYATGHLEVEDDRLVTGIGIVNPEEADDIAMVANIFARRRGISLAVVWGVVGNRVRICARSNSPSISLKGFLQGRFGEGNSGAKDMQGGRSEGGAGIVLDLGLFNQASPEAICKVVHESIRKVTFSK